MDSSKKTLFAVILAALALPTAVDGSVSLNFFVRTTPLRYEVRQDKSTTQVTPPNAWRGFVPLVSRRADVEHKLGVGKPHLNGSAYIYESDTERVDIVYSKSSCNSRSGAGWDVPEDTVILMDVAPRSSILIQSLHLDPKKYIRVQLSHPQHWFQYRNEDDGIVVQTIKTGNVEEVYKVTYQPSEKNRSLRCY